MQRAALWTPYLIPYLYGLLAFAGILVGEVWAISGLVILLILHPLLDEMMGRSRSESNLDQVDEPLQWILYFYPLFQSALLVYSLSLMPQAVWQGVLFSAISMGVITGGLGITIAHELVHRRKAWERAMGVWLLAEVNYTHFRLEHVFGHHQRVATPEDPATARKNESLYRFWIRSLVGGYLGAWSIETQFLKNRSGLGKWLRHRMVHYLLIAGALMVTIYFFVGLKGLTFFIVQALVAVLLLETVNYIEHYGLLRKKDNEGRYQAVGDQHSWDSSYRLTNFALVNLGKHAHHHRRPGQVYSKLKNSQSAPDLPYGYSTMILASLVPPLFFRVMNPLVEKQSLRLR